MHCEHSTVFHVAVLTCQDMSPSWTTRHCWISRELCPLGWQLPGATLLPLPHSKREEKVTDVTASMFKIGHNGAVNPSHLIEMNLLPIVSH